MEPKSRDPVTVPADPFGYRISWPTARKWWDVFGWWATTGSAPSIPLRSTAQAIAAGGVMRLTAWCAGWHRSGTLQIDEIARAAWAVQPGDSVTVPLGNEITLAVPSEVLRAYVLAVAAEHE